jgi:hypothetical protein
MSTLDGVRRRTGAGLPRAALACAALALAAVSMTGCAKIVQHALNGVTHGLIGGNAALNAFTGKVQNGESATYDVTYVTSGSSPATVEYTANPPHDWGLSETESSGSFRMIQNSAGLYYCTQQSSGATWSCLSVPGAAQTDYLAYYQFFTGTYWVDILKAISPFVGLTGLKIEDKSMKVNGFDLSCIVVSGTPNGANGSTTTANASSDGTYCVTSQGILGYVSSGTGADYEIKSYSTTPNSSLFQEPAGATTETLPTSTTS